MKISLEEIPKKQKQRLETCSKRLQYLNQHDDNFNKYIQRIHFYYLAKFDQTYNVDVNEKFIEQFESYASDIIFQGYYLILELLDDDNTTIPNDFLSLPNGRIREMTFSILDNATGDLNNLLKNQDNISFDKEIISTVQNVASFLTQIKIDYACIGAAQALIDERYNRKLLIQEEPKGPYKGILTRSDDLFFVDSQKYLVCIATSPYNEVWRLYTSSAMPQTKMLGEVRIQKFESPKEMFQSLPFYEEEIISDQVDPSLSVGITLFEEIPKYEQTAIENLLIDSLTQHTTNIQVTMGQISSLRMN